MVLNGPSPRPLAQLTRKVQRAGHGEYIVTLDEHAVTFRKPHEQFTLALPYAVAIAHAERLAGDVAYAERKRKKR